MMDGWGGNGWSGGGLLVMGLLMVALVAVAVWAVLRLSRRTGEPTGYGLSTSRQDPGSARHILDRRLASGEIDEQQYAQTRRVLDGRSADQTRPEGPS